jgi:hypothetical protein
MIKQMKEWWHYTEKCYSIAVNERCHGWGATGTGG